MAPVIPKDAEEAERLGYPLASEEEIEARKGHDVKAFSENRAESEANPMARATVDCSQPGSDKKTCLVSNCIDGFIFVYVCDAGVCMKRAYKIKC